MAVSKPQMDEDRRQSDRLEYAGFVKTTWPV